MAVSWCHHAARATTGHQPPKRTSSEPGAPFGISTPNPDPTGSGSRGEQEQGPQCPLRAPRGGRGARGGHGWPVLQGWLLKLTRQQRVFGKPFPGNARNVLIPSKAASVRGCRGGGGNPLPEPSSAVNRPGAIKTLHIPPAPSLGSGEGPKRTGMGSGAQPYPKKHSPPHQPRCAAAPRRCWPGRSGCSGPGKCLSPSCGFMTTAWKNFGCFFPFSGRGAGGKAPLCPPGREAAPGPAWRGQSGVLRASESQGWEVWGLQMGSPGCG